MLTLDVFSGQITPLSKSAFESINCAASFIPGGTTGYLQVCDVAVNAPLKKRIAELSEIHYDKNELQWIKGEFSISDRRVLLTQWVAEAWNDFHKDYKDTIIKALSKLGYIYLVMEVGIIDLDTKPS
jgi:hypothetical protein